MQAALNAHRLVTLTGVGGVGKTRLALECGRVGRGTPTGSGWSIWPRWRTGGGADAVAAPLGIPQRDLRGRERRAR